MLCLRFRMDGGCFGLEAARIVELVPWVELWPLKSAPDFICGCFNYRGAMTPVVDLSRLFAKIPTQRSFSSRIAVVRHPGGLLGLLLEGAIETVSIVDSEFQEACVRTEDAPYMGRMVLKEGVLIQVVEPDSLLPESVRHILFPSFKEGHGK